jgi:hypothetical protein
MEIIDIREARESREGQSLLSLGRGLMVGGKLMNHPKRRNQQKFADTQACVDMERYLALFYFQSENENPRSKNIVDEMMVDYMAHALRTAPQEFRDAFYTFRSAGGKTGDDWLRFLRRNTPSQRIIGKRHLCLVASKKPITRYRSIHNRAYVWNDDDVPPEAA